MAGLRSASLPQANLAMRETRYVRQHDIAQSLAILVRARGAAGPEEWPAEGRCAGNNLRGRSKTTAMRIAVTGTTGFVGRALVPALAARQHDVRALGREVLGDIAAYRGWARVLEGVDAVVHLAAIAHRRGSSEARLRAVNIEAPVALGKAAAATGAHMLFLSSVKALGEETTGAPLDEASPFVPRDAYGRAKAEAERSLRAIAGLKLTVLRPPLVYGPGVKANFFALLRAVDRGLPLPLASVVNRRSLVYVGNLANVIVRCLELPQAAGRTYLVSDGEPSSTPQLVRILANALGQPERLFPCPPWLLRVAGALLGQGDSVRRLTSSLEVDDRAVRRELGWAPPFTFEEGIRLTARWYLDCYSGMKRRD